MLKKSKIIIILGLLTALMPFLGFRGATRDTIIIIFSLTIVVLGFLYLIEERRVMRKNNKMGSNQQPETFIDNSYQFDKSDVDNIQKNESKEINDIKNVHLKSEDK